MLTPQNRAKLKSIAATQKDLVYIGQNNLTDNVVEQIKLNLFAHELIKVKVQKGAEYSAMELAEMICDKIAAGIVYSGKDWKNDTQIKYYMKERNI